MNSLLLREKYKYICNLLVSVVLVRAVAGGVCAYALLQVMTRYVERVDKATRSA